MKIIKLINPPFGSSSTRYVLFEYPDALSKAEARSFMSEARAQGHEHARQAMAEAFNRTGETMRMGDYDRAVFARLVQVVTPAGFKLLDVDRLDYLDMRDSE